MNVISQPSTNLKIKFGDQRTWPFRVRVSQGVRYDLPDIGCIRNDHSGLKRRCTCLHCRHEAPVALGLSCALRTVLYLTRSGEQAATLDSSVHLLTPVMPYSVTSVGDTADLHRIKAGDKGLFLPCLSCSCPKASPSVESFNTAVALKATV